MGAKSRHLHVLMCGSERVACPCHSCSLGVSLRREGEEAAAKRAKTTAGVQPAGLRAAASRPAVTEEAEGRKPRHRRGSLVAQGPGIFVQRSRIFNTERENDGVALCSLACAYRLIRRRRCAQVAQTQQTHSSDLMQFEAGDVHGAVPEAPGARWKPISYGNLINSRLYVFTR